MKRIAVKIGPALGAYTLILVVLAILNQTVDAYLKNAPVQLQPIDPRAYAIYMTVIKEIHYVLTDLFEIALGSLTGAFIVSAQQGFLKFEKKIISEHLGDEKKYNFWKIIWGTLSIATVLVAAVFIFLAADWRSINTESGLNSWNIFSLQVSFDTLAHYAVDGYEFVFGGLLGILSIALNESMKTKSPKKDPVNPAEGAES